MSKKYLLSFCFLMIFVFGFSQERQEKTTIPHIRLKADSKKDQISLRWAIDEPLAWRNANKTGFQLKRYTLMRDGKLLQNPEEKDLGIFLPAQEKDWMKIVEKNDNAAIVAQSLFGETF